jgi:hypothetical protein
LESINIYDENNKYFDKLLSAWSCLNIAEYNHQINVHKFLKYKNDQVKLNKAENELKQSYKEFETKRVVFSNLYSKYKESFKEHFKLARLEKKKLKFPK